MKKAMLVNSLEQAKYAISIIDPKGECDIFCLDYLTYKTSSEGRQLKYYYQNTSYCPRKDFELLVNSWHKDKQGRDVTCYEGISAGHIMNNLITMSLATIIREWNNIKEKCGNYEHLYIPEDMPQLTSSVIECYCNNKRIVFSKYNCKSEIQSLNTCDERIIGWYPQSSFRTILSNQLRNLTSRIKNNRILFILDWTYRPILNILPQSSYIGFDYLIAYLNVFRKARVKKLFDKLQELVEISVNDEEKWRRCDFIEKGCRKLVINYIKHIFKVNRKKYEYTLNMFEQVFSDLKPQLFVVPSDKYDPYAIGLQVAKKHGIKTMLLVDGYYASKPENTDEYGKYLFDYYAAFGEAARADFKLFGINNSEIINMPAILLGNYFDPMPDEERYQVIVMTWIPNHENPNVNLNYPAKYLIETIELLISMGYKNIAVKMKSGRERQYVERIAALFGASIKIGIICGLFKDVAGLSDTFIGGVSSAITEIGFLKKKYYIYEPEENGNDFSIESAPNMFQKLNIARTIDELSDNLTSGRQALAAEGEYFFGLKTNNKQEYEEKVKSAFARWTGGNEQ